MIETGLVYVHSAPAASGFVGCGALVEGPFVVTCRHVWDQAEQKAGGGAVQVCFPAPRGEGEAVFCAVTAVDPCLGLGGRPDLVILEVEAVPGGNAVLEVAREEKKEVGRGYVLAGLVGRDPDQPTTPLDTVVWGDLVARIGNDKLREFTGTEPYGYWTDHGCSGSPLATEHGRELAGIVVKSETGPRPGEAGLRKALVLPATTIHRHLRLHVGLAEAKARKIDAAKVPGILATIGAATASIAEIRSRLGDYFDGVAALAAESLRGTNAGGDIDGAVAESRRLSAAFEPARAMAVLDEAIDRQTGRLLPLLREKVTQQRLVFDHAGAVRTLQEIAALDPGDVWTWLDLGDVRLVTGGRESALEAYRAGELAAERSGDARDLSVSRNRIGDVLLLEGDRDGALAAFRDGIAIAQDLAARDPGNTEWQRDLCVSHTKIGDVLLLEGDRDGALAAFRDGLAIRQALAARDPGNTGWQRDVSVSHDRIGDVLLLEGDRDGAMAAFRAGLAIRQALAARDPGNTGWQRDVSVSHTKIGDVLLREGDRDGALTAFRDGLAIRQALAARDPGNTGWQRDVSVSHNKIGEVLLLEGDRDGALAAFRDGLAIRQALAARDPGNTGWQRDMIVSCVKMASVDDGGARGWLERALAIATGLAGSGRLAPVDAWMIPDLERRLRGLGSGGGAG